MSAKRRVLIAGKSWTVHSIHQKGFEFLHHHRICRGAWPRAPGGRGLGITYQPSCGGPRVPVRREACFRLLRLRDAELTSAPTRCFCIPTPSCARVSCRTGWQRSATMSPTVAAPVMIGGDMTFQGIDGKARYAQTAVAEALLVHREPGDVTGARCRKVCSRPCATPTAHRRRPAGEVAGPSGLQSLRPKARCHRGCNGRGGSADRCRALRVGAVGGIRVRLRPALGPATLRRVAGLRPALEPNRRVGRERLRWLR